jgi:hypothetical protein
MIRSTIQTTLPIQETETIPGITGLIIILLITMVCLRAIQDIRNAFTEDIISADTTTDTGPHSIN